MTMRRSVHVPVALDCGCTVTPAVLNGGEPLESGACLIFCPDHGIRHDVAVAEVVVTFAYSARRLDPADPETAEVTADA